MNRSELHCTCCAQTSCLYIRRNIQGCIWKSRPLEYGENTPKYPGIICHCQGRTTPILGIALCTHSFIKPRQFKLPQVSTPMYVNPWKQVCGILLFCTIVPPTDEHSGYQQQSLHYKARELTFDKYVAYITSWSVLSISLATINHKRKKENTPIAFEQTLTQKQGQVYHSTYHDTSFCVFQYMALLGTIQNSILAEYDL